MQRVYVRAKGVWGSLLVNSRHSDSRRVRTGGPEQQSADRFCRKTRIRGWAHFQFSIVEIGVLRFGPVLLSSKAQQIASQVQPSRSFVASKRSRAMFV